MKVSFIVPLYNCLPLTRAMAASLQATLPASLDYEVIFVDDGSTDGTRAWLATLTPPFRFVLNEHNLGYAAANNHGARLARGKLLVLLNNDLEFSPRWLEPMLAVHQRLGSRAGVVGNVQRRIDDGSVDHAGIFINLKAKPEHDTSLPPRWLRFCRRTRIAAAVTGACALVERELWEKLGGFDENFSNGGEDVDFCFRIHREGRLNAVALQSVIRHHVSASPGRKMRDEQNSRRLALKWRRELEALPLRRWCWNYLCRFWTTPHDSADHVSARSALFFALHLTSTPPPIATAGMRAAMDHELERWDRMLK